MEKKIVELIEDGDDLILPLDSDTCDEMGWTVGDKVKWKDNNDGTWTLSKVVDTELVLVETVQTFVHRYLVEVPVGKKEYALDTVTLEEAKEFSQKHLGELISSHRVVSKQEAIALFKEDNEYLSRWDDEKIMQVALTSWEEQND